MKKFIYLMLATLCLALNFTSCSNDYSSSEDTYRIEMEVVSNSTYETAFSMAQSYGGNITHSNIKSIRDYLYQNTTSNYDNSMRGGAVDEIRNFLRLSSTKRLKMASLAASGKSGAAPFSLSSQ